MTIAGAYRGGSRTRAGEPMRRNRAAAVRPVGRALPSATRRGAGFVAIGGRVLDAVAVRTARLVLLVDGLLSLAWLFGDPNRSKGPAYKPVRELITGWLPGEPSRWWGGILLFLVLGALVWIYCGSEIGARRWFAALTGYWACWAVAYLWGVATQPHAGIVPIGYALMCVVGNRRPAIAPQRVSHKGG